MSMSEYELFRQCPACLSLMPKIKAEVIQLKWCPACEDAAIADFHPQSFKGALERMTEIRYHIYRTANKSKLNKGE